MIPATLALALLSSAVFAAPLPPERPAHGPASVEAAPLPGADEMVCRDPRLMGDPRPDIIDVGILACGIDDPVRVTSVAGIRLSPAVLVGCPTARRLADWLSAIAQRQARAHLGAAIAEVTTMGSYACRTQNNAGRWRSEHARGRAVDIGGFVLSNGAEVTVARDWGKTPEGAFLREIWEKGCGPFSTVLGPDADSHHRDHLHLDTSPRGGEPYCR
ncbi:MAG: extensin-like domain-containing protein [Alphaproteobacteria bacterium]